MRCNSERGTVWPRLSSVWRVLRLACIIRICSHCLIKLVRVLILRGFSSGSHVVANCLQIAFVSSVLKQNIVHIRPNHTECMPTLSLIGQLMTHSLNVLCRRYRKPCTLDRTHLHATVSLSARHSTLCNWSISSGWFLLTHFHLPVTHVWVSHRGGPLLLEHPLPFPTFLQSDVSCCYVTSIAPQRGPNHCRVLTGNSPDDRLPPADKH